MVATNLAIKLYGRLGSRVCLAYPTSHVGMLQQAYPAYPVAPPMHQITPVSVLGIGIGAGQKYR